VRGETGAGQQVFLVAPDLHPVTWLTDLAPNMSHRNASGAQAYQRVAAEHSVCIMVAPGSRSQQVGAPECPALSRCRGGRGSAKNPVNPATLQLAGKSCTHHRI
jgi:hypothetical protein